MALENFCQELVKIIIREELKKAELENLKSRLAKKHRLNEIPKNAQIIAWLEKQDYDEDEKELLRRFLQTKPVRSGSGVSVIAVMAMADCPGRCIYCPRGEGSPQSYTGVEPATMRAKRVGFDPFKQVQSRLRQLEVTGHLTDKCELIIMGGTFPALPKAFQEKFVKRCIDALNERKSKSLLASQKLNESAEHRCVGLTIETRPDYCQESHISQMLKLGTTRVELGVQNIDDGILKRISRGHGVSETINATRLLKDSGLKVCYHMMPGLTGIFGKINMGAENKAFDEIFSNENFKPDLLKVYPTLVIPGTVLHKLWKSGKYKPLSQKQAKRIIMHLKSVVPKWIRIQRMQRDISWEKIDAGPDMTNIRQVIQSEMKIAGKLCQCIRCREVGHQMNMKPGGIKLKRTEYEASGGKEIFLSFEDDMNKILIAYLRLRIPEKPFIKELEGCALVRELHVYGSEVPIGERDADKWQHKGYGKLLLKEAESMSRKLGLRKIAVTSGVGVRSYYKKLGYKLIGSYMIKSV